MHSMTNNLSTFNFLKAVFKESYSLSMISSIDNPPKVIDTIANARV